MNRNEPIPERGVPPMPDWIDEEAKEAWEQVAPRLDAMGVLGKTDANVLARYCQTWSRWKKAELFIQRYGNGYPIKDDQGGVKYFAQFPEVGIANNLSQTLTRLEQELGLTPSARSRITATFPPPRPPPPARESEQERARRMAEHRARVEREGITGPAARIVLMRRPPSETPPEAGGGERGRGS